MCFNKTDSENYPLSSSHINFISKIQCETIPLITENSNNSKTYTPHSSKNPFEVLSDVSSFPNEYIPPNTTSGYDNIVYDPLKNKICVWCGNSSNISDTHCSECGIEFKSKNTNETKSSNKNNCEIKSQTQNKNKINSESMSSKACSSNTETLDSQKLGTETPVVQVDTADYTVLPCATPLATGKSGCLKYSADQSLRTDPPTSHLADGAPVTTHTTVSPSSKRKRVTWSHTVDTHDCEKNSNKVRYSDSKTIIGTLKRGHNKFDLNQVPGEVHVTVEPFTGGPHEPDSKSVLVSCVDNPTPVISGKEFIVANKIQKLENSPNALIAAKIRSRKKKLPNKDALVTQERQGLDRPFVVGRFLSVNRIALSHTDKINVETAATDFPAVPNHLSDEKEADHMIIDSIPVSTTHCSDNAEHDRLSNSIAVSEDLIEGSLSTYLGEDQTESIKSWQQSIPSNITADSETGLFIEKNSQTDSLSDESSLSALSQSQSTQKNKKSNSIAPSYASTQSTCTSKFSNSLTEIEYKALHLQAYMSQKEAHKLMMDKYPNWTSDYTRTQRRKIIKQVLKQKARAFRSNETASNRHVVSVPLGPSMIDVKIGNMSFHAHLSGVNDTGSEVNVVDANTCKVARIPIDTRSHRHTKLIVANQSEMHTIGMATFTVFAGPSHTTITAFVVNELHQKLILGTPWLYASKATLDFAQNRVIFKDKKGFCPMSLRKVATNRHSFPLVLTHDMIFTEWADSHALCRPTRRDEINALGFQGLITSDNSCAGIHGLIAATMPATIDTDPILLRFRNTTQRVLKLRKGSIIAHIEKYHKEEDLIAVAINLLHADIPPLYQHDTKPLPQHDLSQGLPEGWDENDGWPPGFDFSCFTDDSNTLSPENIQTIKMALQSHCQAFASNPNQPGRNTIVKCVINTGNASPIFVYPRRTSPSEKEIISTHTKEMKELRIIEDSTSAWSSAVVLVPKPGGKIRFCIDYRNLNKLTVKDHYPLPRVDECISAFNGSHWFSVADCAAGYWGVDMDEDSKEKTAFSTHEGHYQFRQMPFGLSNAPAVFMRLMNVVLAGISWKCCLPYMDDIIIYSPTFEDHVAHVCLVLKRLIAAGLTLKGSKCYFFRKEVVYLGHVVSGSGIHMDPRKLESISKVPPPTDLTELRSFLGLTGYYRRFIERYSFMAKPLYDLMGKYNSHLSFTERWNLPPLDENHTDCITAFRDLKAALLRAPILANPDFDKDFYLQTDACAYGISAILSQRSGDSEHIIACASRKLNSAEQNYTTSEQEALAMVYGCEEFRPYLLGRPFFAETDHQALKWVMSTQNTGRLRRWALKLSEFDINISYKKGTANGNADGTSRLPVRDAPPSIDGVQHDPRGYDLDDLLNHAKIARGAVNSISLAPLPHIPLIHHPQNPKNAFLGPLGSDAILQAQRKDPWIYAITAFIKDGILPPSSAPKDGHTQIDKHIPTRQAILKLVQTNSYSLNFNQDGILCVTSHLRRSTRIFEVQRIWMPLSLRPTVIDVFHYTPSRGNHLGRDKTIHKLKELYFWPNMVTDIKMALRACTLCERRKPVNPKKHGLMMSPDDYHQSSRPWSLTQADVVGPLQMTSHGHSYILVATDHLTKWKIAVPLTDNSAITVCDALLHHVFYQHGYPDVLVTDQGSEFTAEVTRRLCARLNVDQRFSTAYHHNTVAESERFTRFLKDILSLYVQHDHTTWDSYLPALLFAYNTSVHPGLGDTPYFLLYGVDSREPTHITTGPHDEVLHDAHHYRLLQLPKLRSARRLMVEALHNQVKDRADRYNATHTPIDFPIGSQVLQWTPPAHKQGTSMKFHLRYNGPYNVLQKLNDVNYRLQHLAKMRHEPIRDPITHLPIRINGVVQTEYVLRTHVAHVARLRPYCGTTPWSGKSISVDKHLINDPNFPSIETAHAFPDNITISDSDDINARSIASLPDQELLARGVTQFDLSKSAAPTNPLPTTAMDMRRSDRLMDFHQQVELGKIIAPSSTSSETPQVDSLSHNLMLAMARLSCLTRYYRRFKPQDDILLEAFGAVTPPQSTDYALKQLVALGLFQAYLSPTGDAHFMFSPSLENNFRKQKSQLPSDQDKIHWIDQQIALASQSKV